MVDLPPGHVTADGTGILYSALGPEGPEMRFFSDLDEMDMTIRWANAEFDRLDGKGEF
jgi:hypothetical protein